MFKLYLLFVLVACVCLVTEAQLTFTSSWGGKRSMSAMGSMGPIPPCKNDDAMAAIFKMIQNEAQRMILCQKQP